MAPSCAALGQRLDSLENRLNCLQRIEARLGLIEEKLEKLNELDEVTQSLNFMNNKFEEMREVCSALKNDNQRLSDENVALKEKVIDLEYSLDEIDSYNRRNNIEIRNVPEFKGEATDHILAKIGEILEVEVNTVNMEASHRVPSSQKIKPIIARFVNRRTKDAIISAAKKKRLSSKDLGFPGEDKPIYIAEQLTHFRKILFAAALEEKRLHGWKHLWTSNGKILSRFTDGSRILHISSRDDLKYFSETDSPMD